MKPPLRFLNVLRSLDPATGGPVEGWRQMAAELVAEGHQADVVTLDRPDAPWLRKLHQPASRHWALGSGGRGYGLAPGLVPWLRTYAGHYDLVVVHGLWQWQGLAAWLALAGGPTPYAVWPHGMLDPWFRHAQPFKHAKKRLYWALAEGRVLRDAAALLYTCTEEARLAPLSFGAPGAPAHVLGYGLKPPQAVSRAAHLAAFLARWPELAGRRIVLFLGRLHPKKGCDLLLRAFAHHAASHPRLHLVFAGPDEQGQARRLRLAVAERGLHDRVSFTGMLDDALKWGALEAAEVFVLPSHQENFGIAAAEALAAARPVLLSTQVNIWREVEGDGAGFAEPDTEAGTLELLQRWLALDAPARQAMGQAARTCFERRFEIAGAAQRLVELTRALEPRNAALTASKPSLPPIPSQP